MFSVSGKKWIFPSSRQKFRGSVSSVLAQILETRHIATKDIPSFLDPKLRTLLPDPSHLLDMQAAVQRVTKALLSGEKMALYGDYDVDGATSIGLLVRYFRSFGRKVAIYKHQPCTDYPLSEHLEPSGGSNAIPFEEVGTSSPQMNSLEVEALTPSSIESLNSAASDAPSRCDIEVYIPDRLAEGYGVNLLAIKGLIERGARLILMVDCGTTSVSEVDYARSQGVDTLIFDHHVTSSQIPEAVALVNPHRLDHPTIPWTKDLCSAGLVFLFLIALQKYLRENDLFVAQHPDLMSFCDFVALGTVCDVMPLRGLNRALVRRGLEKIQEQLANSSPSTSVAQGKSSTQLDSSGDPLNSPSVVSNPPSFGLQALCCVANVKDSPSAHHLGFALGPRINAGGRVGASTLGVELLTTTDPHEASALAQILNQLNEKRRILEQKTLSEAKELIQQQKQDLDSCLLVGTDSWHPGVVGIVASRLKEAYQRPCFVAAFQNDVAKGSARSVEGLDVGQLIHSALQEGYLIGGGGHPLAGGFTVVRDKWEAFRTFLIAQTKEFMATYTPILSIDAELYVEEASLELIEQLEKFEPLGAGNPQPRFFVRNILPQNIRNVGQGHVQCHLTDAEGHSLRAIAFRSRDTPLDEALRSGRRLFVVGALNKNTWQNRSTPQFILEDAAWE